MHRDHGPELLPTACQQFPRISLTDDRGTFVTLSHFCPTAADLLFADRTLEIVEDPPAFPADREYDGLDARGEWPPTLRPGVLFDLASYSRWEAYLVSALAAERDANVALREIANAAERLRAWTARAGPFTEWTSAALDSSASIADRDLARYAHYSTRKTVAAVQFTARIVAEHQTHASMPDDDDVQEWVEPAWSEVAPVVRRYLAAKAFGSWCAYQAHGVRTLVAELHASETVLKFEAARLCLAAKRSLDRPLLREAIRASDWLLVHAVDRARLTEYLGQVENDK